MDASEVHGANEPNQVPPGLRLGRVLGVEVHVGWGVLLGLGATVLSLSFGLFKAWQPEWRLGMRWSLSAAAAALFLASILMRELAHAKVARACGVPLRGIVLHMFGGIAELEREPPRPRVEAAIAAAGPAMSLVLGLAAIVLALQMGRAERLVAQPYDLLTLLTLRSAIALLSPLPTILLWLGAVNLVSATFHLLPAYPLEGGRVLRALLWSLTRDCLQATRISLRVSRALSLLLISLAASSFFAGVAWLGVVLVLLGAFLYSAPLRSYEQLRIRRLLQDVPVSRLMCKKAAHVGPDTRLEQLMHDLLHDSEPAPVVAVESDRGLLGLLWFDNLDMRLPDRWADVTVRQVMIPLDALHRLGPDACADRALDTLSIAGCHLVPIVSGTQLCGVVRPRDVARWLARHSGER